LFTARKREAAAVTMAGPPERGANSITVAIRVRPFTIREAAQLVKNDDGTLFLGDGSLAAAPTPKLMQKGIRPVIKVVDDRCLYVATSTLGC
jgi:kinesin family protein 18/19